MYMTKLTKTIDKVLNLLYYINVLKGVHIKIGYINNQYDYFLGECRWGIYNLICIFNKMEEICLTLKKS